MLTSKQRAGLRSSANTKETILYVGKEGITDATVKEEVEIPTQPTPEEGGATEPTRGDTSSATDADASVSGNKIPGWGGGSN